METWLKNSPIPAKLVTFNLSYWNTASKSCYSGRRLLVLCQHVPNYFMFCFDDQVKKVVQSCFFHLNLKNEILLILWAFRQGCPCLYFLLSRFQLFPLHRYYSDFPLSPSVALKCCCQDYQSFKKMRSCYSKSGLPALASQSFSHWF